MKFKTDRIGRKLSGKLPNDNRKHPKKFQPDQLSSLRKNDFKHFGTGSGGSGNPILGQSHTSYWILQTLMDNVRNQFQLEF